MKTILNILCDLTAPRFLGPYGLDFGGCFPMPWDEEAHYEKPSRLHLFLVRLRDGNKETTP